MILVIDNYDSFTYNLVHLVATGGHEPEVVRNDAIEVTSIESMAPTGILISPGPGRPDDAGITKDVIERYAGSIPILGVCLGHQAIGEVFGGKTTYAPELMHGKTSRVHHDGKSVFQHVEQDFIATRYHSLIVDPESFPDAELEISATTGEVIMGMRHRTMAVEGIQFHPESVLTEMGPQLINNWLKIVQSHMASEHA